MSDMVVFLVYVAKINVDQTEGRGPLRPVGYYDNHLAAYEKIKGQGVMGVGDGEVYEVKYILGKSGQYRVVEEQVYYGNKWGVPTDFALDRWRPDLSPVGNDPEWAEYVRLREKFGDK